MKRIFGSFVASCFLLAGCGGGLQSPDFEPVLKGVAITFTPAAGTSAATTAPGSTFQFTALGLYSTPPGTSSGTGLVSCMIPTEPTAVCTTGAVSGVTWSIDPTTATTPIASVNSSGLASGLRRGTAVVRAKVQNFEDTESLRVSGAVLTSFTISATPNDGVVPTGRPITLTATASCADSGIESPSNCIKDYTGYSWTLPSNFPADTVTFNPSPATGKIIVAKTNRFGAFSIDAVIINEEGDRITKSIPLNATERVLDDIIVSADPTQSTPVPVIIGTQTRFVARGLFSDGAIADIRAGDLRGGLTWSQDVSAVGQINITNAPAPNTAVLVSGETVGATGLTATGRNIETTQVSGPNGLELLDRVALEVRTFGLLGLVDICQEGSAGNECLKIPQLPLGDVTTFVARGRFQNNPNNPMVIDQTKIPLTWSKTPATATATSGDLAVGNDGGTPPLTTGEYTAIKQGAVTINVALTSTTFEPDATPRSASMDTTVIEQVCNEQFLSSNGTAIGTPAPSNNVTTPGNVIDSLPNTRATITVTAGLLGAEETLSFQRAATLVTPPAAGQNLGFLIAYDPEFFAPDSLVTIQTLDAGNAVVQNLNVISSDPMIPTRNMPAETLIAVKANATLPYTGVRITIAPPDAVSPLPIDIPVVGDLLALLLGGGETDVQVYALCSNIN